MGIKKIQQSIIAFCFLTTLGLTGCQTSTAPVGTANAPVTGNNRAPQRVDIRGSIIMSRYDQGQVMLEVEGFPSQSSRYNRAYVLVQPITQIVGPDGQSISLSELRQGQNVAILLRGGGQGNLVGLGVARKVWVEEIE
ncbi:hypothetical protein [Pontibacter pamirensis]|uniref:hypothetical protein n=1 Tax=Pontibacter pamirensis TaxID=2562824 RepID=UPI00138A06D3|nr:hypothetical protein [Pontibacter pamirensis]